MSLQQIDNIIFNVINKDLAVSWLDSTMPLVTDLHKVLIVKLVLFPIILFVWWYIDRLKALWLMLGLTLTIVISDFISHSIVKSLIQRARPRFSDIEVILRSEEHYGYSFTSNHATNMFAFAFFLGAYYPKLRPWFFVLATIIAYSRVYVGVHYPSDVLGGALLGLLIGWLMLRIWKYVTHKFNIKAQHG